jgi:hypothetical protein
LKSSITFFTIFPAIFAFKRGPILLFLSFSNDTTPESPVVFEAGVDLLSSGVLGEGRGRVTCIASVPCGAGAGWKYLSCVRIEAYANRTVSMPTNGNLGPFEKKCTKAKRKKH